MRAEGPLQPPPPGRGPSPRPGSPAQRASSSNSCGGRQPGLPRPRTAPSPAAPRRPAKEELEGSATGETNVLGASPASFPRVRLAPVTSASLSRLLSIRPGAEPQARSPRVPVPRAAPSSGSPRRPDCPRDSRVCLRRPCPRGARAQPQVGGEVGVPGSPPATHRGEGALRPRREPAPAASRALHVPAPRPRALARSVLARRAPEPGQRGARVRGAAWRAGQGRPPPRARRPAPSRGPLGAWLRPGLGGTPRLWLPGLASRLWLSARRRPRGPAPPGPAASAPPRPAPPPAPRCSRPLLARPRAGRLGPFSPLRGCVPRPDTWGQVRPRRNQQPAWSPGFEPAAH
ncbi:basic proline-rich protein-like [Panthera leo]|uniref:basic proline-rich protein-like n=1 Tax=Panthera leo TaxID=9689 RepID=UPI001C695142|nr:basic proline-rich protein-like [Panthera leo]